MEANMIQCPGCGKKFALNKAITSGIEAELRQEYDRRAKELAKKSEEALEQARGDMEKKISDRLEKQYELDAKKLRADAMKRARKELAGDLADKEEEIVEAEKKLKTYRSRENAMLKKERELEEQRHTMTVEFNEKLNKEVKRVFAEAKEKTEEEFRLKLQERDKVIQDLNKQMKEGQKKAEQGSMQLQGEVLELEMEDVLARYFPEDLVEPVSTGKKGGDIVQTVRFSSGKPVGKILWELKRTKNWSATWIAKVKEDQRQIHAEIAVIASEAVPLGINSFGLVEGVWVTEIRYAVALASALRENLKALAVISAANEGKAGKSELVYQYLTGVQFRQRVESVLEAYVEMQNDLDAEKRSTEKSWAKREKQIERFIKNISGMYGDLQGLGAALPDMKLLAPPEE